MVCMPQQELHVHIHVHIHVLTVASRAGIGPHGIGDVALQRSTLCILWDPARAAEPTVGVRRCSATWLDIASAMP